MSDVLFPELEIPTPPAFLSKLLSYGIRIDLCQDEKGIYYDLNLLAKSHLHLRPTHEADKILWIAHMRYGDFFSIEDLVDLLSAAVHGMHGRPYINASWRELLVAEGFKASVEANDLQIR